MSGLGPAACWLAHKRLESWSRMAKERVGAVRRAAAERNSEDNPSTPPPLTPSSVSSNTSGGGSGGSGSGSYELTTDSNSSLEECNLAREPHAIQPLASVPAHTVNTEMLRGPLEVTPSPLHTHLQHQSKSFPPRLTRTPSVSSQSSVDSAPSRQSGHRGSSPQIRTFGPDGRTSIPPDHGMMHASRSPSPLRAISLDARCSSPGSTDVSDIRTPSPSQSSLASIVGGSASSVCLQSPKIGRCLSPLLIPPRIPPGVEAGCGPASPLGALQPDLYTRQEGPIYLTAPELSPALGRLHLRIKYDYHLFDLAVHLIEAHNLCPIEDGGFRDPYVRLMLEPEVDQRKRQTSIHRGESNPYFDQHFKFPVSRDQLSGKQLILQVLDYDRYSHNDIIGEVRVSIDDIDLSKSVEIWGDVLRVKKPPEDRPEILISLNFLPQAERLTVVIMKAKNLDTVQEPYVKLYLIQNGKRVKKKKTSNGKSNDPTNPIWNEAFNFSVPTSAVNSTGIEIYVVSTGGEANAIGSCGLGLQEHGPGKQHWQDMIHNARKPTAMWHYLR
ncbi:synaptotagmin-6 isoform X1 [Hermetia illucens]|uniref:synaptotagmin-6 isoform X1 n=1 Tax=Hermetia illucens TaxID=343691 RepID=UPI0018CC09C2|nr:synaptotagmin-6 isoform X1 [Hermetia illucens]XP_037904641.1 synaptotagmin-6 isoform X1 [Hermetia illucens]XP_037904643.1 synaptotagmin-6 isoform X1 [Hermetia illucens]XP_037904644.1 synaptotagmin-6 isoform X1 [Hermetia illucens]XP_037904645.1 synaptotagmin-6 isoform X1 [Hermetia illucens]XP_037904646.1 synaptotagmin-6 isoform X1 [Hermetia illucens]XP_037904647.1 synaptotagmin-6 isoform X1 [Hermetia illucens]